MAKAKGGRSKELQVATRDYTLNMHKRLQGIAFKKRATRAVRVCARFAASEMHTEVSISMSNLLSRSSNLILTNFIHLGCESGHSIEQTSLVKGMQKRSKTC